jgi:hypothetical protein
VCTADRDHWIDTDVQVQQGVVAHLPSANATEGVGKA